MVILLRLGPSLSGLLITAAMTSAGRRGGRGPLLMCSPSVTLTELTQDNWRFGRDRTGRPPH